MEITPEEVLIRAEHAINFRRTRETSALRREGMDAARLEVAHVRGALRTWVPAEGELPRRQWTAGEVTKIRSDWYDGGLRVEVLGPAVFVDQWWVPIKKPGQGDPTFFKEAGLESPK